ncbi:Oxidoreductase, 2OG-Fe(II) oxygenase family protein [Hibiscus syriacus]|uniref:Oxidoreductase, 2OG-Fe(II) oxygenase family protein n=1 Tax=Hibiscus syriacus TaxID=106335 RepID=A0A6A3B0R8_HIBSY|nr:Oxidoreductase, 2OG-Fe(II) oxygenase family protein [Hibiscus syriacus]
MACMTVLHSVSVTDPWRPLQRNGNFRSIKTLRCFRVSPAKRRSCVVRARDVHFWKRAQKLNSSNNETSSSSSSEEDDLEQGPPQEAVLKAISEVSKTEGRVGETTNVVIGGTVADDSTNEWLALDQKVNSYPTVRGFTAIGTGGDDFVQSMVIAVESVIQQPIPEGRVKQKLSSRGKYVSVNIGPVQVVSSEQVQAVYMP